MVVNTSSCPCIDAHRRLLDVHEDIHRVIENYLEPHEFRRYLNSAIQNSRSVTFLLQKRKSKLKGFDVWYPAWQDSARGNSVLAWSVGARNRIVKESDLETHSLATVDFYGPRLKIARDTFQTPPSMPVEAVIGLFREFVLQNPSADGGSVRIQRKWIDAQLPEYELVAALREVYQNLSVIVQTAHGAMSVPDCDLSGFPRSCLSGVFDHGLACIPPGNPLPVGWIDGRSGEVSRLEFVNIDLDPDLARVAAERYGSEFELGNDAIEHAHLRLETSKRFLEADGYAGPFLLLFNGKSSMRVHPTPFPANKPREMIIEQSIEVNGAWQFDGAVFASELWITVPDGRQLIDVAPEDRLPSDTELFDPDPIGGRDEALTVVGLTKDGRNISMVLPFARTKHGIHYGELMIHEDKGAVPEFLRPIWSRWPSWKARTESRGAPPRS